MTIENEDAAAANAPAQPLTAADKVRLQGLLAQAIEDNEECPICFGVLAEPRITSCAHCYCLAWYARFRFPRVYVMLNSMFSIAEVIQRDPKCPMVCALLAMGSTLLT